MVVVVAIMIRVQVSEQRLEWVAAEQIWMLAAGSELAAVLLRRWAVDSAAVQDLELAGLVLLRLAAVRDSEPLRLAAAQDLELHHSAEALVLD